MGKQPKQILEVLEKYNNLCSDCGSDQFVIVTEGITLCRLCFAEKAGMKLKFNQPSIEVIMELEKQGRGTKFVSEFLGLSTMQIGKIRKRG